MRQTVSATGAPAAVGSYSQAVKAGNLLFLSGQLCANPETGRFERESVAAQTRRLMENIKALIEQLNKIKPASTKGVYIRKDAVSSTMGPGVKVDVQTLN